MSPKMGNLTNAFRRIVKRGLTFWLLQMKVIIQLLWWRIMMILQENILPLVTQLNTRLNNKEEIMSQFTKSFLWRFILDIILLGIFVRLMQNIILAILSRSMETYSTPFLIIEAVVVSVISMLFICFITYWNIGVISNKWRAMKLWGVYKLHW